MSALAIMHLLRFRVSSKQRVLRKERFPALTTEASLAEVYFCPLFTITKIIESNKSAARLIIPGYAILITGR
jgi:hypothetical protein